MAFILLFWHVIIHVPILGSEGGDTPEEQVTLESRQSDADEALRDAGFEPADLRDAVETADDIDDEIAPVAWSDCKDYSQTDNAALVVGGAAGAAGASASAASCASAGAAGGGAC